MVRTSRPPRGLAQVKRRSNGTALSESRRAELVNAIREAARAVLKDVIAQLDARSASALNGGKLPVFFPHGIGLIEFEVNVGLNGPSPTAGLSFTVAGVKDVPAGTAGKIVPSPSIAGRG